MPIKQLLYGWAPGAQPFAEDVRAISGITGIRVGPVVTLERGPFSCTASRRHTRLTIRYPATGADQIIFADRDPNADPASLTATIERLWQNHSTATRQGSVSSDPRKGERVMTAKRYSSPVIDSFIAALLQLDTVGTVEAGVLHYGGGSDDHVPPSVEPIAPGARFALVKVTVRDGKVPLMVHPLDTGLKEAMIEELIRESPRCFEEAVTHPSREREPPHAGTASPDDAPDHDDPPPPPVPSAPPERTDPVARSTKAPEEVTLTPREAEVYQYLLGVAGKTPDKELQAKARKKFGDAVTFQWFALRKADLIKRTPDGYVVHKAKVTIKERGNARTKKQTAKKAVPKTPAPAPKLKGKDALHAAADFFTAHPDLLDVKLMHDADVHQAALDAHGWKAVLQGGIVHLVPLS